MVLRKKTGKAITPSEALVRSWTYASRLYPNAHVHFKKKKTSERPSKRYAPSILTDMIPEIYLLARYGVMAEAKVVPHRRCQSPSCAFSLCRPGELVPGDLDKAPLFMIPNLPDRDLCVLGIKGGL